MNSLVTSNFSRTYNPCGRQNALSDIKRLLTSRDTVAQIKACGYLVEVIGRYNTNSTERIKMVEYLLENDITVFLCEATANLDLSLFRSVLSCFRLLWRHGQFFSQSHAAPALSAVLRALAHYAAAGSHGAVDSCLHFVCDFIASISTHGAISPLSNQSAYSADQLLACLLNLAPKINNREKTILSSALVLHSLISYQPDGLKIKSTTAIALVRVISVWLGMMMSALNHSFLVGTDDVSGMFYGVVCQLGINIMKLSKILNNESQADDFVQSILMDANEVNALRSTVNEMITSIYKVIKELIIFTKDNHNQISTDEYGLFLRFLFLFLSEQPGQRQEISDLMFTHGYLRMLPQTQIVRKDASIRKVSTLVLGEILKALSHKYLSFDEKHETLTKYDEVIHTGLMELQYVIDEPHSVGLQLRQCQPYTLLIYMYFYAQSTDDPHETTAILLPHLIEHILRLPKGFKPPKYVIKALWLVFAMSTMSNASLKSLDERIVLEKATERLVWLLQPNPSEYYTHNPAILLWSYTSARITNFVRFHVLSQWLKLEDAIPTELAKEPAVWEMLLNVLTKNSDRTILDNTMQSLQLCVEDDEGEDYEDEEHKRGDRGQFAAVLWEMLPTVLSRALIKVEEGIDINMIYLLELSTKWIPAQLDSTICEKVGVLVAAIFLKTDFEQYDEMSSQFQYVSLKLCLYLLELAANQQDNKVVVTLCSRAGFLPGVARAALGAAAGGASCVALALLSSCVLHYQRQQYRATNILELDPTLIVSSLRQDTSTERDTALLQLLHTVLSAGVRSPLRLADSLSVAPIEQQWNAFRAILLRVQMLCCKESTSQISVGWKTLTTIFKHAVTTKNDTKLVASLTTQPWTHVLINYQLTRITPEFLTFLSNWLILLTITMKNSVPRDNYSFLFKNSIVYKTFVLLKKYLIVSENDDLSEGKQKVLGIIQDTLDDLGVTLTQTCEY